MENEHKCINCKCKIWNTETKEWECKYADIPNREECNKDFEEE